MKQHITYLTILHACLEEGKQERIRVYLDVLMNHAKIQKYSV